MRSLAGEDAEKIAIEGDLIASLVLWVFCGGIGDERVDGAVELVGSPVPVQAIVVALLADQFLCELLGEVARGARRRLLLRIDQFPAGLQGGKFVVANAPRTHLSCPGALAVL